MFSIIQGKAQTGFFINDSTGYIRVENPGFIYVQGDFQVLNIFEDTLPELNGNLFIERDFVCNKKFSMELDSNVVGRKCRMHFVGNGDSHISGTKKAQLYGLVINKTSGDLYIDAVVEVHDTIEFIFGNAVLDTNINVELKYREGTNTVEANPCLKNETAAHRFIGDGFITTKLTAIPSGGVKDIANTGFKFWDHEGDTLYFRRGHRKQLFAGEGSIDWFFDIDFRLQDSTNTDIFDTIALSYLIDVDYAAIGVDTSKLKMYVSNVFDDATYIRTINDFKVGQNQHFLIDSSTFYDVSNSITVAPNYFRVTLADTSCSIPPLAPLTDSLIHLCAGDSLSLEVVVTQLKPFATNFATLYWNDSSSSATRTFYPQSSSQEYVLKVTDIRGCYTTDTLRIAPTAPNPTITFQFTNVCEGLTTQFIDTSFVSGGTTTSSWNFGDTNTLINTTLDTVTHLYSNAGLYGVTLTVESNYGCILDSTFNVSVYNYPVADFSLTENCFFGEIQVNGNSSVGNTIPDTIGITPGGSNYFLDGAPIDQAYDTLFNLPTSLSFGTHTLSLGVVASGCTDTLTQIFTVYEKDTAGFTVANGCVDQAINFNNVSYIPNTPATYSWMFDNNPSDTSSLFSPTKVYSTPGTKFAQLIVNSASNCNDTFNLSFEIYGLPNSFFSHSSICVNDIVTFSANSIVPTNNYSWSFGNSQTGNNPIDTTIYTSSGNYLASLTVTDTNLCSSTSNQTIAVQVLPIASFNALDVCLGETTLFFNTSTGNSLTSSWDFGDSSPIDSTTDAQHLYANSGSFFPILTVTDVNGCSSSSIDTVIIHALPVDSLSDISTCGSSYPLNAFNSGSTYLWSPSNEFTQSILVNSNGLYTVTITNANGCQRVDSSYVTLNSVVTPNLGADGSACGQVILNAGYPGSQYNWNIATSDSTNQSIVVTNPGVYSVTVTDLNGCIGTDSVTITAIYPFANPDLGLDQQICESNFPIVLNPGTYSNYQWSDNSTSSTFTLNSTNNVWVYVTDANGCSAYDTISIVSLNSPESDLISSLTACDNATLLASNNLLYDYNWNTGQTSNFINVNNSGVYSVQITDPSSACNIYDTINVTINQTPFVDLGNDISVCANLGAVLDAGNSGSSYIWTSTSGAILSTNQTLQTTSSDFYSVVVTNNGCSDSSTIYVDLLPAPFIPSDQTFLRYICGSTPVLLEGSPFGDNLWTSTNGFSSTDDNVSVYEIGNYYVTASIGGCSVSDTFELQLSPQQIEAFYLVDTDTNTNLSLKFIDLSSPTPISYFWNFGDGTYDSVPNPVHTYPIVDTFYTSLTVSNGVCISTYSKMVNAKDFVIQTDGPVAFLEQIDFSLYPNPVSTILNYHYLLNDEATTDVVLYDMTGKVVKYVGHIENERSASFEIDTYDLMPGVYYLGMKAQSLKGNIKQTLKIIKL